MIDELEIISDATEFNSLIQEADRARAYIRITQEMGPSPQLLAFVNYDHSLKDETGAGLESLSENDQHFFIMSRLNPDCLDQMALENLSSRARKVSEYLSAGGWAALLANFFLRHQVGYLAVTAIAAGYITRKVLDVKSKTFPLALHQAYISQLHKAIELDSELAVAVPNNFEEDDWKKFNAKASKLISEFNKQYEEVKILKRVELVPVDQSGWTENNFSGSIKDFETQVERIKTLQQGFAPKIKKIESYFAQGEKIDPSVMSYVSAYFTASVNFYKTCEHVLSNIKHVLEEVSFQFEEKKH